MVIYIDLLIILNIGLDFMLLLSVSIILKRNTKLYRFILGSLIGGFTSFCLFINISSSFLFLVKIILGILMVIVTFNYQNIRYTLNNFYYLIVNSIILGGGLYLIKDLGKYNYIILVLGFLIILIVYLKTINKYKQEYINYYKVNIFVKNKEYHLNGYLDTGNKLYDQYQHRPVILVSKKIPYNEEEIIYVPFKSLNNISIVKCLKTDKVIINKKSYYNYLIGLSNNQFAIDGINCILPSELQKKI